MLIEEFLPTFHYITGKDNIVADYLLRAPLSKEKGSFLNVSTPFSPTFDSYFNAPAGPNPISYARIRQWQQADPVLVNNLAVQPQLYHMQLFGQHWLICRRDHPQHQNWKICVPDAMLAPLLDWYHEVLLHLGVTRQVQSLQAHYFHPHLAAAVKQWIDRCRECQLNKNPTVQFGQLPPREAHYAPFYEVAVDSVGPWPVRINNEVVEFKALTMIDTVTNFVEIVRVNDGTAAEASRVFQQQWLYRYPRPVRLIHDAGSEFKAEFMALCDAWAIDRHPIGVRSPQANAICERMHKTVGDILRVITNDRLPADIAVAANMAEAQAVVEEAIGMAAHALRCSMHTTLGASPGSILFNRDMFLDIPYIADWILLRNKRQRKIDENLRRANSRRNNYDYRVGDPSRRVSERQTKDQGSSSQDGPYLRWPISSSSSTYQWHSYHSEVPYSPRSRSHTQASTSFSVRGHICTHSSVFPPPLGFPTFFFFFIHHVRLHHFFL